MSKSTYVQKKKKWQKKVWVKFALPYPALKRQKKKRFVLRHTPINNFSHYHPQVCCDASRQSGAGFRWSMWCFAHGSWRQEHACLCRRLWPPLQAAAVSAGPRWLQKERRKCFKSFITHSQNSQQIFNICEFLLLGVWLNNISVNRAFSLLSTFFISVLLYGHKNHQAY